MQAMILAAGFGTRLQPYTNLIPKPLFPILNTPLLSLVVNRLKRAGFSRIIVNCHHLRDQIAAALNGIDGVILQEEEHILGTGGGLRKALEVLLDEPLLVTNGDIYHTIDPRWLYLQHQEHGHRITLAMHDYPRFNSVAVQHEEVVAFCLKAPCQTLAFTGLHVIDPVVLSELKKDAFACIIDLYKQKLAEGERIFCCRVDQAFWTDMGTIADYLELHRGLLYGEVPAWEELGPINGPISVSQDAVLANDVQVSDWACIGRAEVKAAAKICRSVIWDDAIIESGRVITDGLVTGGKL